MASSSRLQPLKLHSADAEHWPANWFLHYTRLSPSPTLCSPSLSFLPTAAPSTSSFFPLRPAVSPSFRITSIPSSFLFLSFSLLFFCLCYVSLSLSLSLSLVSLGARSLCLFHLQLAFLRPCQLLQPPAERSASSRPPQIQRDCIHPTPIALQPSSFLRFFHSEESFPMGSFESFCFVLFFFVVLLIGSWWIFGSFKGGFFFQCFDDDDCDERFTKNGNYNYFLINADIYLP